MIIRKPYAFLIKYFKIIHIILFVLMSYLTYKTRLVYFFFRDYAGTGTYTYINNIASFYVNIFMVFVALVLVVLLILIYLLMKQKEKKVLIYLLGTIFYFLSFISYIFFITVFRNLEYSSYNTQILLLFRDISLFIYYLNYIFIVIAFIRGFGFNIKQFNFGKDLMELDISDEDREEIEVSSGIDYENVSNFVRRRKRNFMYYIKENSFILTFLLGMILVFFGAKLYITNFITDKVYSIGEIVNIQNVEYVINNCFIINKDSSGNIIKENANYVIIDLNIINKNTNDITISSNVHRLKVNNKYYYNITNVNSNFDEFGTIYKNKILKSNENNNLILVYEIENNYQNMLLELFQEREEHGNEAIFHYKKVKLEPYEFKEIDLGSFALNQVISLNNSYFGQGEFSILNMDIKENVSYKYNKCITEDKCYEYEKIIIPNQGYNILKINYKLDIDKNLFRYLIINNKTLKNITPNNYEENSVLLEIPNDISSDNLILNFNIRGVKFNIVR